ncbi:MAG: hypothetical protein ACQEQF_00260 [Bacillota bacterium]
MNYNPNALSKARWDSYQEWVDETRSDVLNSLRKSVGKYNGKLASKKQYNFIHKHFQAYSDEKSAKVFRTDPGTLKDSFSLIEDRKNKTRLMFIIDKENLQIVKVFRFVFRLSGPPTRIEKLWEYKK